MPLALITSMTYEGIGLTMIAGHIMTSIIHSPSRLAVDSLACRSTGLDSGLMVGSSLTTYPLCLEPQKTRPIRVKIIRAHGSVVIVLLLQLPSVRAGRCQTQYYFQRR